MDRVSISDRRLSQLLIAIRRGNSAAECALLAEYQVVERIRSMVAARMRVAGKADREDIIHDIITALILSLRSGRFDASRGNFGAFLWGITRNHILMHYKRESRGGWSVEYQDHPAEDPAPPLEQEELRYLVSRLLFILGNKYRHVVELRYFEEMSIEDIAACLELHPKQVRNRITYAFQLIRRQFAGEAQTILHT